MLCRFSPSERVRTITHVLRLEMERVTATSRVMQFQDQGHPHREPTFKRYEDAYGEADFALARLTEALGGERLLAGNFGAATCGVAAIDNGLLNGTVLVCPAGGAHMPSLAVG